MKRRLRLAIGIVVLIGIPFYLVQLARKDLAPMQNTPKARQKGDPKGKILIVEYSDFQCPACASIEPAIKQLMEKHEGKIRFAYKYYPLMKVHKNAFRAAQAAECASEQGGFWPYHGKLYSSQADWRDVEDPSSLFTGYARDLQLKTEPFAQCLSRSSTKFPIEADIAEGKRQQIKATPTFFVNNKRFVGRVFETEGVRFIEEELNR